jgi:hypothetical protein
MQKFEATCRYRRKLSDEEKAELETKRIISGEDEVEEPKVYIYGKLTFDLNDVKAFNDVDEDHTCLRTYQGEDVMIKMNYNKFKQVYMLLTGNLIKTEGDFLSL